MDWYHWLTTPAGQSLQDFDLSCCDKHLANLFGYHAVQLGLANYNTLRNSRIAHRFWAGPQTPLPAQKEDIQPLLTHFTALPFPNASIDLLVLPHTLELYPHPKAILREAARVLVPEGHLAIHGINPTSLWNPRLCSHSPPLLQPLPSWQLHDWLSVLGLEIEQGQFGCYRPALQNPACFARLAFMEKAGDRWWPFLGGAYFLVAVKRVAGVHLLEPAWKKGALSDWAWPAYPPATPQPARQTNPHPILERHEPD